MIYTEDDFDWSRDYQINNNNNMENGLFTVSWVNVKSALISGVLVAVLGIAGYIVGVGDIFNLDIHTLANIGVLAGLNSIISLIKAFLTTKEGNFAGVVEVHPPN